MGQLANQLIMWQTMKYLTTIICMDRYFIFIIFPKLISGVTIAKCNRPYLIFNLLTFYIVTSHHRHYLIERLGAKFEFLNIFLCLLPMPLLLLSVLLQLKQYEILLAIKWRYTKNLVSIPRDISPVY